jgi:RNA polymerase sigma-70 factor, ECF subfamily
MAPLAMPSVASGGSLFVSMTPERENEEGRPVDPLDSTAILIARVREGDDRARDRLIERYRAALCRWTHGRIPSRARDLVDTDDLVQSALYRAMAGLDDFEVRRHGAFLSYLRQIVLNQIRDEYRRSRRRPDHTELEDHLAGSDASPLDRLIERERLACYERALEHLPPRQREAVVMRLEFGCRYREIAEALGLPSGNAARLLTARGLVRLTRAMKG